MTTTTTSATGQDAVFGGVDSHADTIHVAVITDRGGHVADAEFPTTAAGYAAAIAFLNAHGTVTAVGVEGTSSYGLGFTRAARHAGLTVIEVNRPDKAERRRIGSPIPSTPTQQPAPRCPAGHRSSPRTTPSAAYAPSTTPPGPPSRPAPPP
ncbi:IS110 family transposase [Streptomyces brevispora]|uniref:IS110 family transposase n=1 Tax=Streptomyces brevispora TaxID=887462 RepID=UPI001FCC2F55|nr:transposase [Streptomyces brevispora]